LAPKHQFDRIVVSCATPRIEPAWIHALREPGAIIAPVGDRYEQTLVTYRRDAHGVRQTRGPRCRFVSVHAARGHRIYRPAK
jgi:protein-L-isoaspartate(D-aspartate) O-methyltransferase